MKMQTDRLFGLFGLCFLLCTSISLAQSVPDLINYQGRLLTEGGDPAPTAEYAVTGSLFAAASGGDAVWTETLASVPVVRGYFNLILGGNPANGSLATRIKQGTQYIEVTSGAYSTGRQSMLSVPFALQAANSTTLAGRDWSSILVSGNDDPSTGFIEGDKIEDEGIGASQIADRSIAGGKIVEEAIGSFEIANNSIDSVDVENGTLTGDDLASNLTVSGVLSTPSGNHQLNGKGAVCWKDSSLVKLIVVTHTIVPTGQSLYIGPGSQAKQTVNFGSDAFSGMPYAVWLGNHDAASWIGWAVTGEIQLRAVSASSAELSIYRESTPVTLHGLSSVQIVAIGPR